MPCATTAAEPPLEPPGTRSSATGIAHRAEGRVLGRRAHGELVAVGLAQDHAAGALEPDHGGGVVGGDVIGQQLRAAGGANALGENDVLDRYRHAGQRAGVFAASEFLVDGAGRLDRSLGAKVEIGVGPRIPGFGEAQGFGGEFPRAELALRPSRIAPSRW